ncbi:hypothetical protein D0866_05664 [Hortaea werneckii]|uniref:Small ribosomal subunit protein uS9m n=2 Tax=Hortaea werneckii TaxID=91943 RepID=A0A3M7B267_HORWE|nr:hypothetical protein D0866_05664 [Hortaea werneckii]
MEGVAIWRTGMRRAVATCQHHQQSAQRCIAQTQRRFYASPTQSHSRPQGQAQDEIKAAPQIDFQDDRDQFARPRTQILSTSRQSRSRGPNNNANRTANNNNTRAGGRGGRGAAAGGSSPRADNRGPNLAHLRIIPASPSYFTATPKYTDDLLLLSALQRRHQLLPVLPPGHAPRVAWKTIDQYKTELAEPVRAKMYGILVQLLKRLNYIHPALMPDEVRRALDSFKREVQPHLNVPKPIQVSEYGVAVAAGRRKSSTATVHLVEGTGQCLINGKSLSEYFGRLHDRESAVWALKATARLDKYNVWATTEGGGTTGQAEAVMLGVGRALLAHEPDLKMAVRRAGAITRNPKRVERKKPGKLKARKMPAWVKR